MKDKFPPFPTSALRGCSTRPSRLTLGTWGVTTAAYGEPLSDYQFQKLVETAFELGVDSFDLGLTWDGERAMRLIADVLGNATLKCFFFLRAGRRTRADGGVDVDFGLAKLREDVDLARDLLQVKSINALLLHSPPRTLMERGETMQELSALKDEGVVGGIGLSTTQGEVAVRALDQGFGFAALPYNTVQTHAVRELDESLPAQAHDDPSAPEGGGKPTEDQLPCVLACSPLLHGVLAARVPAGHQYPPGDHRRDRWTEDALRTRLYHARALSPLVDRHTDHENKDGTFIPDLAALSLRFALSHPRVASVAVGPRDPKHLQILVSVVQHADPLELDNKTLAEIETLLASAGA